MKLREVPEFQGQLEEIDRIWQAWAVGAYGRQLLEVLQSDRTARVQWIMREVGKPLAIAMREIPMDDNWPEAVRGAVEELASTDPAFFAIVQALALFLDDLIEMALTSRPLG